MPRHTQTSRIARAILKLASAPHTAGELLAQISGWHSQLLDEAASVTPYDYDQRDVPLGERGGTKWYKAPRGLADVTTLMVHSSGVDGGFGVAGYQWRPWRKVFDDLVAKGSVTDDPRYWEDASRSRLMAVIPAGMDPGLARDQWAMSVALMGRYLRTPYHYISAPNSVLVRNLAPQVVSWHGNQNRNTIGWALDDIWSLGEMPRTRALDYRRDFREIVTECRDMGCVNLVKVKTHRQTSGSRAADPGPDIFAKVVVPEMDRLGLVFDSTLYGTGRAVTRDWWGPPVWPAQG